MYFFGLLYLGLGFWFGLCFGVFILLIYWLLGRFWLVFWGVFVGLLCLGLGFWLLFWSVIFGLLCLGLGFWLVFWVFVGLGFWLVFWGNFAFSFCLGRGFWWVFWGVFWAVVCGWCFGVVLRFFCLDRGFGGCFGVIFRVCFAWVCFAWAVVFGRKKESPHSTLVCVKVRGVGMCQSQGGRYVSKSGGYLHNCRFEGCPVKTQTHALPPPQATSGLVLEPRNVRILLWLPIQHLSPKRRVD